MYLKVESRIDMKRSGRKITASHTTVIDAATLVVDYAKSHRHVTKISLGFITPLRSSGGIKRLKIKSEDACLHVIVRGNTSKQQLRIYTKQKDLLATDLTQFATQAGFETQ